MTHEALHSICPQSLVHRPQEPDQIFSIHWMPRDSAAGRMWQFLDSIRRREGRCPKGFLPFEDVLKYGQRSLIVVSPWLGHNVTKHYHSNYLTSVLRIMQGSFAALAHAHDLGISLNIWPRHWSQKMLYHAHALFLARQFVFDKHAIPSYDHQSLGAMESSDSPRFAEIVGRPFSRQTAWAIPCKETAPDRYMSDITIRNPDPDPWPETISANIRFPWSPGTASETLYPPTPPIVSHALVPLAPT